MLSIDADAPLNLQAHGAFLIALSRQLNLEVVIQLLFYPFSVSLSGVTAVAQKCMIQLSCITKSFDIFRDKSSCRARYKVVNKCRVYVARAVGKIAGFWEHGVCIVGLLNLLAPELFFLNFNTLCI